MRPSVKRSLDYLVYVAARLALCIVEALPTDLCHRLARSLATLFCNVIKFRAQVVDDNIRQAFPELSAEARREMSWRMWEHLFLMVVEVIHAPRKIHDTNWRDYVTLHNADLIIRTLFDDRPTVMICGHYGNFELSGYIMGLLGLPTYTIARPLDNPFLDRYMNAVRSVNGQHMLSKTGSSGQIDAILAGGGALALLADQHAGPKGCWVDFFGKPASSHKAIALFTLGAQAPTIFCYTRRTKGPLHLLMGTDAIIDPRTMPPEMQSVPAITQWYTRQLEDTIRQEPEQYWWVHRRWKDAPPKRRAAVRDQAA